MFSLAGCIGHWINCIGCLWHAPSHSYENTIFVVIPRIDGLRENVLTPYTYICTVHAMSGGLSVSNRLVSI